MTSLFSFSSPADIDIRLDDEHDRKTVEVKTENPNKETIPVYFDGESLQGTVRMNARGGRLTSLGRSATSQCEEAAT